MEANVTDLVLKILTVAFSIIFGWVMCLVYERLKRNREMQPKSLGSALQILAEERRKMGRITEVQERQSVAPVVRKITPEQRKALSKAAKKRWAQAKREGRNAL